MKFSYFYSFSLSTALAATVCVGTFGTRAVADVWTARCQNVQFTFDRGAKKAIVYFQAQGKQKLFPVAQGPIVLDNGTAVRAQLSPGGGGGSFEIEGTSEIALNRSREIVYVVNAQSKDKQAKDGVFCETPIQVTQ